MFSEGGSVERIRRGAYNNSGTAKLVNMDVWYATTLWLALLSGWIDPSSGRRTRRNPTGGILMKPIVPPAFLTPQMIYDTPPDDYVDSGYPFVPPQPPLMNHHGLPYDPRPQNSRLWRSIDDSAIETRVPRNIILAHGRSPSPFFPSGTHYLQRNPIYPFQTYPSISSQSPQKSSLPQPQNMYQHSSPSAYIPSSNMMDGRNQFSRTQPMPLHNLGTGLPNDVSWNRRYAPQRSPMVPVPKNEPQHPSMANGLVNIPRNMNPLVRVPRPSVEQGYRRPRNSYLSDISQEELLGLDQLVDRDGMMMQTRSMGPSSMGPPRSPRSWQGMGNRPVAAQSARRRAAQVPMQYVYNSPDYFEGRHSPRISNRPLIKPLTPVQSTVSNSEETSSEEFANAAGKLAETKKKEEKPIQQQKKPEKLTKIQTEKLEVESAEGQTNSSATAQQMEGTSDESKNVSSQSSEETNTSHKEHHNFNSHKHNSKKSDKTGTETDEDHKKHGHCHHHHSKRSKAKAETGSDESEKGERKRRRTKKTLAGDHFEYLNKEVNADVVAADAFAGARK